MFGIAVQLMNGDVIPTFEDAGARIDVVLSDNGRELCGRPDSHPFELFLQLEEIEHRTLLDEHFRVEGRRTWFESLAEMQRVRDDYLVGYNTHGPHQGRAMNSRTPAHAFTEVLPKPTKQHKEAPPQKSAKAAGTINRAPLSGDYSHCTILALALSHLIRLLKTGLGHVGLAPGQRLIG